MKITAKIITAKILEMAEVSKAPIFLETSGPNNHSDRMLPVKLHPTAQQPESP
jgi:hypothetical protein